MEVTIHPKSKIKPGDLLKVDKIYEDRLNMASLRYERTAVLELINPIDSGNLVEVCRKLLEYRKHNTLNFQLEKADDYFWQIENILAEIDN